MILCVVIFFTISPISHASYNNEATQFVKSDTHTVKTSIIYDDNLSVFSEPFNVDINRGGEIKTKTGDIIAYGFIYMGLASFVFVEILFLPVELTTVVIYKIKDIYK